MVSLLSPLSTNNLFMTQEAGVILLKHVNPFQLCHSFSLYRPMAFPFHSELIQISYSGLRLALDLVFCSVIVLLLPTLLPPLLPHWHPCSYWNTSHRGFVPHLPMHGTASDPLGSLLHFLQVTAQFTSSVKGLPITFYEVTVSFTSIL